MSVLANYWGKRGFCTSCLHCGMDMDLEPFCVNEKILAVVTKETGNAYPHGLYTQHAWRACMGNGWEQHPLRMPHQETKTEQGNG